MKIKTLVTAAALAGAVFTGSNAYAGDWTSYEFECGEGWGPSKQVAPTYPKRAQQRGLEGYIVMNFSVTPEGKVEDIVVEDAKPAKAFVRSATHALSSTEFQPCVLEGVATRLTNVSIKYDFNLR